MAFYILTKYPIMSENYRLNPVNSVGRIVRLDGIQAVFVESSDNSYDVSLNVNSQKFFIRFSDYCGSITDFEIVSFKGFMVNLTNSLVLALRNLIEVLWSKL